MNKPPAYQHYAKEWLVGTAHLSLEEQGAYQRLLDHEWEDGPLPPDPIHLARLLGVSRKRFAKLWLTLERFFPVVTGRLANPKLEDVRAKLLAYREKQAQRRGSQPGASPQLAPSQPPASPHSASASASVSQKRVGRASAAPPNWVAEAARDMSTRWEGTAPHGRIGKALAPLVKLHGWEAVRVRWGNYLESVDPEYGAPEHFARSYGKWGEAGGVKVNGPVPYDVCREAYRQAGISDDVKIPPGGFPNMESVRKAIATITGNGKHG